MSLFGGVVTVPPSPSPPLSHIRERSPSPQNAQAQHPSLFVPDPDDSIDEDLQPSSSDAESAPPERSAINPSSWRRYTAADREIAASLQYIESADLAAHLYNAHSLKRRVRRPAQQLVEVKDWQDKDSWSKKDEELQYSDPLTGELQTELVPSKAWTAWPLPPNRVPTREPTLGVAEDDEEGWYVGSSVSPYRGDVMREELLALFLRTAKEKWIARQVDAEDAETHEAEGSVHSPKILSSQVSDGEMEMGTGTTDSTHLEANAQDERNSEEVDGSDVDTEADTGKTSDTAFDSQSDGASLNRNNRRSSSEPWQSAVEPTFLADDDEARRILEPSINSLLSSMDRLALAVRRNRLNHLGSRAYSSGSESECPTDGETPAPRSRASSRLGSQGRVREQRSRSSIAKRPSKGPQKPKLDAGDLQDADLTSGYGTNEESEDDEQSESSGKSQKIRAHSTSSNSSQSSSVSNDSKIRSRALLMDWSELLGIAAVAGWDKRAIARTAQRCSSLFGERMSFRTFEEGLATQRLPQPVHYRPSPIPTPDDLSLHDANPWPLRPSSNLRKRPYFKPGTLRCPHQECGKQWKYPSDTIKHMVHVHSYDPRTNNLGNASMEPASVLGDRRQETSDRDRSQTAKRPYFDPGALRCPHAGCPGSMKDFSGMNRLVEHVQRKHGYDPRTNDSDNEERTVGGVHVDGFLQPISAKPGWLGHGRARSEGMNMASKSPKRKRQRMGVKATSTVTSEYETQDGEKEQVAGTAQQRRTVRGPGQRLKVNKTCTNCSRRKKSCDGARPCGRCRQSGEEGTCQDRVAAVPRSCLNCKRRRQKCDCKQPCARCEHYGEEGTCEYS